MNNLKKAFTDCDDCINAKYSKSQKMNILNQTSPKANTKVTNPKTIGHNRSPSKVILQVKSNYQRYLDNINQKTPNKNLYVRKVSYDVNPIQQAKFQKWNSKVSKILTRYKKESDDQ